MATFSVTGIAQIREGNVPQARADAMLAAFRNAVVMATEQLISQDRLQEISSTIEDKIYKRAKNFIHHFKPLKSEILDTEYHLPVEVTVSLKELRQAFIENKILALDYAAKMIHLINLKRFQDYEWVRDVLEKDTGHLKRLVETYQKQRELRLRVETSSSLEELMAQLNSAKSETGSPPLKVNMYPGVLEITFL
ncbi:MAG: hypothetical protein HYW85_01570 [Deltaproteobacteria bacterium]|nr:hypothetical protein [Deltaproteobacteria bacterium]